MIYSTRFWNAFNPEIQGPTSFGTDRHVVDLWIGQRPCHASGVGVRVVLSQRASSFSFELLGRVTGSTPPHKYKLGTFGATVLFPTKQIVFVTSLDVEANLIVSVVVVTRSLPCSHLVDANLSEVAAPDGYDGREQVGPCHNAFFIALLVSK